MLARVDGDAGRDRGGRLRDRARVGERGVPRRSPSTSSTSSTSSGAGRRGEPRGGAGRARREARRERRRRRRGALRGRRGRGPSRPTCTRRRNKIGVLVRARRRRRELARLRRDAHLVREPRYLTRDEVPEAEDRGRAGRLREAPGRRSRSPRRSVRRSSTGMLVKRFFAERVLADQAWIHDDSLTRRQGARRARGRGASSSSGTRLAE